MQVYFGKSYSSYERFNETQALQYSSLESVESVKQLSQDQKQKTLTCTELDIRRRLCIRRYESEEEME